jgi:hypothetical protein
MAKYAAETSVSPAQSREEIERTLVRWGASGFMYAWQGTRAQLAFEIRGRQVRFSLPLPDRNAREFTHTPEKGLVRSPSARDAAYEQAVKQRWRALALVVKAKLEAVEAGIVGFDEEFLAHIVVGEQTVGEVLVPQLEAAIEKHAPLALLPGGN